MVIRGTPDAIGGAIAFAVEKEWLWYEGAWAVTPAGAELGRRSRVGVMNKVRRL
jgi:hypothetical protein